MLCVPARRSAVFHHVTVEGRVQAGSRQCDHPAADDADRIRDAIVLCDD
jgi:hypothetical protein